MRGRDHKGYRVDQHPSRPETRTERKRRMRGVSAWLLEWRRLDRADDQRERRVVGVLSPRLSAQRVGEIARALFYAERMQPGELRYLMLEGRKAPGHPQWEMIKHVMFGEEKEAPWTDRFRIGGDPYLYCRLVKNLKEPALGALTWDELPVPQIRPLS